MHAKSANPLPLLFPFFVLTILLFHLIFISASHAEPFLRILPLGDGITQSAGSQFSYRYELWKDLVDDSISFDFVGSQNDNFGGNPGWPDYLGKTFDSDHEGHWGLRVDEINDSLSSWMYGNFQWEGLYTPDLVLCHLGTEDISQNRQTSVIAADIRETIDLLRGKNGNVVILLAKLIPSSLTGMQAPIDALNTEIIQIAKEKHRSHSPVYLVDQTNKFNAENDTYDGIHPNSSGEEKMADEWIKVIHKYLQFRIMPLGNSITDGGAEGYRYPLFQRLTGEGWNIDFVGTQTSGTFSNGMDRNHEGHPGWVIKKLSVDPVSCHNVFDPVNDCCNDGLWDHYGKFVDSISPLDPDAVLLHIGTNDVIKTTDSVPQMTRRYSLLLDSIQSRSPQSEIHVASVIPTSFQFTSGPCTHFGDLNDSIIAFNLRLKDTVIARKMRGERLQWVDLHSLLNRNTDLKDGVHPNSTGYQKMSNGWYNSLIPQLNPIRILPLGDGLTYGLESDGDPRAAREITGYRKTLTRLLQQSGIHFKMIGHLNAGVDSIIAGAHGGIPQITAGGVQSLLQTGMNPVEGNKSITPGPYLDYYHPDIILLHVQNLGLDTSVAAIDSLLNEVDAYESKTGKEVRVLVAKTVNRSAYEPEITQYNANLEDLLLSRIASGDKLVLVDMENGAGIDYGTDFSNNTYPNATGYEKMGQKWFNTITQTLQTGPVAIAGSDTSVMEGDSVILDASASHHPESLPLSYLWRILSGPGPDLSDSTSASISFQARNVVSSAIIVFELKVSDGIQIDTDTVSVSINGNYSEDDFLRASHTLSGVGTLPFRIFFPDNYSPDKKWPLMLWLHGAAGRGNNNESQLYTGCQMWAKPEQQSNHPAIIVAPQVPSGKHWSNLCNDWYQPLANPPNGPGNCWGQGISAHWQVDPTDVMLITRDLLDSLQQNLHVDTNRIYVSGQSMGGYGVWDMLGRYHNLFAAAVPAAGGGDPSKFSQYLTGGVWNFHAANDPTVLIHGSREIINKMYKGGGFPRYYEYPDGKHNIWNRVWTKEPELVSWVFAHQKGDSTAPSAPTGLQVLFNASDEVRLSWEAATDPESGISTYFILRNDSVIGSTMDTVFSDTTAVTGQVFEYGIVATNGSALPGPRSKKLYTIAGGVTKQLTVVPLGNSITTGNFRYFLQDSLLAAGIQGNFFGTMSDGSAPVGYDPDHEGHPGWIVQGMGPDEILCDPAWYPKKPSNAFRYDRSDMGLMEHWKTWLSSYPSPPDVVLLLIGTNDFWHIPHRSGDVPDRFSRLIDTLTHLAPNTHFLVSTTTPSTLCYSNCFTGCINDSIQAFNQKLPGMIADWSGRGRKVHFVDQYNTPGLYEDIAANDGIHPTDFGHEAMANTWSESISTLLHKPWIKLVTPSDSSSLPPGDTILLTALADDVLDSVVSVDFKVNGMMIHSDSEYPFRTSWEPVGPGDYQLTVQAMNSKGVKSDFDSVYIQIENHKIMPLGNSLVQGVGSSNEAGYRSYLYDDLNADFAVDFVGSLQHGNSVADPDHEGHHSANIHTLLTGLPGWLQSETPHSILLTAGANDLSSGTPLSERIDSIESIIDLVYDSLPNTNIFLTSLPPLHDTSGQWSEFNRRLSNLVVKKTGQFRPTVFVDFRSVMDDGDLGPDQFHPTDLGYAKMAAMLRERVSPVLRGNLPPVVYMEMPSDSSTFSEGISSIQISGRALDADGGVAMVEYLVNDTVKGICSEATYYTYSCTWNNPTAGNHRVSIRATDVSGDTSRVDHIVAITEDAKPPELLSVFMNHSQQLLLEFDEKLDPASAESTGNYVLSGGISVLSANLTDDSLVVLNVSTMSPNTRYSLTASNIEDNAQNIASPLSWNFTTPTGFQPFAFAFGKDNATQPVSANPAQNYVKIVQDGSNFLYSASNGYGFTDVDGIDPTANDRTSLSGNCEIFDQFIGAREGNITFRVDVPNGHYRLVISGGDYSFDHFSTLSVQDGGSGKVYNIFNNLDHPASQYYWVSFGNKPTPPCAAVSFLPQIQSPLVEITNGFMEITIENLITFGGDISLLEIWPQSQPNLPPVLTQISDKKILAGNTLNLNLTASDSEGDSIRFSAFDMPMGMGLVDHGDGTATLTWPVPESVTGLHSVIVQAGDGMATDTDTFNISVFQGGELHVEGISDSTWLYLHASDDWHGRPVLQGSGSLGKLLPGNYLLSIQSPEIRPELIPVQITESDTLQVTINPKSPVPLSAGDTMLVSVGGSENTIQHSERFFASRVDLDRDGQLDFLTATASGSFYWYRNDGGSLDTARVVTNWFGVPISITREIRGMRVMQWNNDLNADIMYVDDSGQLNWMQGINADRFQPPEVLFSGLPVDITGLEIHDANGDQNPDLFFGRQNGNLQRHLFTGSDLQNPGWADAETLLDAGSGLPLDAGDSVSLSFLDWNGDGMPDLLTGSAGGLMQVFLKTQDKTYSGMGALAFEGKPYSKTQAVTVNTHAGSPGFFPTLVLASDVLHLSTTWLRGDFFNDSNDQVDVLDLSVFGDQFGRKDFNASWNGNVNLDLTPDGAGNQVIDVLDLAKFGDTWGNKR